MPSGERLSPYVRAVPVFVERAGGKLETLDGALAGSGFSGELDRVLGDTSRAEARVAIKANIMGAVAAGDAEGTCTDPELVEALVDRLRESGLTRIAVVDSRLRSGPSVSEVAARLGYRAERYELVDLSAQTEPFEYGGVLGRHPVAPAWRDADFRISFAKNKTQWECFYSGAMANVLGCLPEPDKRRWYRGAGHSTAECVRSALDALPVHFGIVDAWSSRDGSGYPARGGRVRPTGSVLAGANVVALDWVMGEKMGVDPALNPLMQEALHRWGRIELVRHGDLMAWDPWTRPGATTVALAGLLAGRGRWTIQ